MRIVPIQLLLAIVVLGLRAPTVAAAESPRPTYGQEVIAAVLMGEAWSEGEEAMIAVAEVIRGRADHAGLSPLAAVLRPFQFTCLNGVDPKDLVRRFHRHPDYQTALRIARWMYNAPETLPGHARGATHFERLGTRAYWTRGQRPVVTLGRLAFYRLPR